MIVGNLRHGIVIPLEIGAVTKQGVVQTVIFTSAGLNY